MITIGELFAGIGGFSLAFHAAGARTAWFVEKEPYCQQALSKHWLGVPIYSDIYDCHDLPYVDILSAGFPCQPFSQAGLRKGEHDERYLVPEMLRVIQEVQPRVCVFENVPGFTNIAAGDTFKQFLRALAESGYDAEWEHLRASDIGAPHRRERWFCVAYGTHSGVDRRQRLQTNDAAGRDDGSGQLRSQSDGRIINTNRLGAGQREDPQSLRQRPGRNHRSRILAQVVAHTRSAGRRKYRRGQSIQSPFAAPQHTGRRAPRTGAQPRLGRDAHGLPARLDEHRWPARPGQAQFEYEPPRVTTERLHRTQRLKALGNSVVPQVVYPIACEIIATLQAEDEAAAGEVA